MNQNRDSWLFPAHIRKYNGEPVTDGLLEQTITFGLYHYQFQFGTHGTLPHAILYKFVYMYIPFFCVSYQYFIQNSLWYLEIDMSCTWRWIYSCIFLSIVSLIETFQVFCFLDGVFILGFVPGDNRRYFEHCCEFTSTVPPREF